MVNIIIFYGIYSSYLILREYYFNILYSIFDSFFFYKRFIVKCVLGLVSIFIKYICFWFLWILLCLNRLIVFVLVFEDDWMKFCIRGLCSVVNDIFSEVIKNVIFKF